MGDPTDTELASLNTIDQVAIFAQLDGAENDVRTARGSLLQLLGFTAGARLAALGMISEADVDAALAAWKIPTVIDGDGHVTSRRDPTMAELGKAKLIARICRQKIGIGVSTTGVPTTALASSVAARKIKLSQVLSQVNDTEIDVLTEPQLVGMYARYEHLFGKGQRPHPSREPSVEQLTAIHGLIRSGQNPYVDFAIFGPFATRLKKRLKFQGLTLSKDGELIQTELHGPQNFATWKASFEVYYNALIMADAVDLGSVLDYLSRIERFHDRFGEKAWALLYQADVRARLEELPRVKMQLAREHADAGAAGLTTPFEPSRPWNYAFKMLSERDKFWNSEFSERSCCAGQQTVPASSPVRWCTYRKICPWSITSTSGTIIASTRRTPGGQATQAQKSSEIREVPWNQGWALHIESHWLQAMRTISERWMQWVCLRIMVSETSWHGTSMHEVLRHPSSE